MDVSLDAKEQLLSAIFTLSKDCIRRVRETYVPLQVTKEIEMLKDKTTVCSMCHCNFEQNGRKTAYNHLHCTGKSQLYNKVPIHYNNFLILIAGDLNSIICVNWNILVVKKSLRVLSHTFSEKDGLAILRNLKAEWLRKLRIIPKSDKSILSFQMMDEVKFTDTSLLLNSSIGDMTERLMMMTNNGNLELVFPHVFHEFRSHEDPQIYTNKMAFPVRYRHFEADTPTDCPLKEELDSSISPDEYQVIRNIYYRSSCRTMCDFAKIYTRASLFQLADSLNHIVQWCIQHFNISPLYCETISSFAFHAAFAFTGAKFEHLKDPEMIGWISKSIKAGLSFSNYQYAHANSDRIGIYNGVDGERNHIVDIDLNGAYAAGAAMNLAEGEYNWLSEEELQNVDILSLPDEGDYGYLFEVTMHCPDDLMDFHNPLPPAVCRRKITYEQLSPYQQSLYDKMNSSSDFMDERLILDLFEKKNYVTYHKLLKLFMRQGIKVTKVHRALRFKTSPYLKDFIHYVMSIRKASLLENDNFINQLCKLMLCSLFGKFLSTTESHADIKTCSTRLECVFYASKPTFSEISSITEDLSLIHFKRNTIYHPYSVLNAFIILENCKEMVYRGWYKFHHHFKGKIRLLSGETDSLKMQIFDEENNFIAKMRELGNYMDYSSLPPTHPLFSRVNQCKLGKWKVVSLNIVEHISIKPKLLCYTTTCDKCHGESSGVCDFCMYYKTMKTNGGGIKKSLHGKLTPQFYRDLLQSTERLEVSDDNNKYRVSSLDVRRYFPACKETSYAFGHPKAQHGHASLEASAAVPEYVNLCSYKLFG